MWRRLSVVLNAIAIVIGEGTTASAQSSRGAVYGEAGLVNVTANDSEQGNSLIYGGEAVFRLRGPLHAGIDVDTGSIDPTRFGSDFRQTSPLLSAFSEWPQSAHLRGIAGGGVGWLFQRKRGQFIPGPRPGDVIEIRGSYTTQAFHGRGGVVVDVSDHVRFRAEALFAIGGGLSAIIGGRAGIGYAF
jgi:hypothetical protein